MTANRELFSSPLAAILTMSGAAIGLGNIWRFPYMMGSYGGSAFFFVYLMFVLLFAVPALAGEWAFGRHAKGGTVSAFIHSFGSKWGRLFGYVLTLSMLISASYYLIVIGNVAYMTWFSILHGFSEQNNVLFLQNLSDGPWQYGVSLLVLLGILMVTYKGLNKGIEMVSKLFVPFFFVVIFYLIFVTFRIDGAVAQMAIFLQPDFSKLSVQSIFAALGQAAFSVGLGGTIMVIYGSYLGSEHSLLQGAAFTALADTSAALLAALFIFPTILVFGISPEAGPKLLFETLPVLFMQMEGGRAIGSFFLLALLLVAFLSGLAVMEVVIGSLSDDRKFNGLSRNRTILIFGGVEATIMLLPALVPNAIASMDLIFGSGMLAFGSALALLGLTWGLKRTIFFAQMGESKVSHFLLPWLRWVVPFVFLGIIALSIFNA